MRQLLVGIFGLLLVIALACSDDKCVVEESSPNYIDTPINWVASSVIYNTTITKKDLSLIYFTADW